MASKDEGGAGIPGPSLPSPVATPISAGGGTDAISKVSIDGLPKTVTTDEIARRARDCMGETIDKK